MKRLKLQFLVILLLASLPLCALNVKKIESIELEVDKNQDISPGLSFHVKVKARLKNGKAKNWKGWSKMLVTSYGGRFSNGKFRVERNYLEIENHEVILVLAVKDRPEIRDSICVQLNYKGRVVADYSGLNGADGEEGRSPSGLLLIGRDGNDGENGLIGADGEDGAEIVVWMMRDTVFIAGVNMIKVKVVNQDNQRVDYFLVHPTEGKMVIHADGGVGGTGGDGGDGGDGKDADEKKYAGDGGNGALGANGGDGGDGGSIQVFLLPDLEKEYTSGRIKFYADGGTPGKPGLKGVAGDGGKSFGDKQGGVSGVDGRGGQKGNEGNPGTVQINYIDEMPDWY